MSGAEEYLDGLLHSVEGGSPADTARETEPGDTADGLYAEKEQETKKAGMSEEDDFLKSFEADTDLEGDADTFIRQFEDELDQAPGEERTQKTTEENNQFFKDLDGILDSARDADESTGGAEAAETAHASEDGDLMVDTIGDFQDDDSDLMDLLQSEGDFPDMSQMADPTAPAADTDAEMPDVTAMPETADEVQDEDDGKKKKRRKKKKKDEPDAGDEAPAKEKKSLIKRIGDALFGEEEETEEAPADTGELQPEGLEQAPELDDLSDENLKLLQELEGTGAAEPEAEAEPEISEEEKKAQAKKEKAEKKAQAKKEKAEKKAQAKKAKTEKKAQKAKKPKKPKEPDNTPPLPKKPVALIMVMAASFLALVLVGTNLFGYTLSFNNAKQAYELGDYQAAFADVSGLTVKEADQETYQKYSIMANAAGEYQAYQTFMENGIYDMALDSLIRAVGRCDKYSEEAAAYGCSTELAKIRDQAVAGLSGFGLTQERAQELYAESERDTYSQELYSILAAAGLG